MATRLETVRLLGLIALRNLFASPIRTLIVGGIIFFGAAILVFFSSILENLNRGIQDSLVESVSGHLQAYNSTSKDALALFGGMMGEADLEPFDDYSKLKPVLESVPNVRAVVPMGIAEAISSGGNYLDQALAKLRVEEKVRGPAWEAQKRHVRWMIGLLQHDLATAHELISSSSSEEGAAEALERAASDDFWEQFDADALDSLEFLENKIAPQSLDGNDTWLRYIGTDLEAYFAAFKRAEIIRGTQVPHHQRGILIGSLIMEDYVKIKNARRLDKMKDLISRGRTIAKDDELSRYVGENKAQTRDIIVQLDPIEAAALVPKLQAFLGSRESEIQPLLVALFDTTDKNFAQRHDFFYEEIAPLIRVYPLDVGDTITIKAFTKTGYVKAINIKIYGIVDFRGVGKSSLAGLLSLMDIMSFRDLYGYMTADKLAEIRQMKHASGVREIARDDAEAALFADASAVVSEGKTDGFDVDLTLARQETDEANRVYTQDEINSGIALNAALLLDDPAKLGQTMRDAQAAVDAAKLPAKIVDWATASGMLGQLILIMRAVLFVSIGIIFIIALVIINNSMVMATLQRIKEIGTLRAIGAQKRFVLGMVTLETIVVGLLFGALGSAFGALLLLITNLIGIRATSDNAVFLFGGPVLHPTLQLTSLAAAFVIILFVSVLSGLYPALIATRIAPVEAMLSEE